MRPEDLETVRRVYRSRAEGGFQDPDPTAADVEGFIGVCDPEVEFGTNLSVVEGEPYRGHDGLRRWVRDMADAFEVLDVRLEELVDAGDQARAIVRVHARGRGGRIEYDDRVAHVWSFRAGKVLRLRAYPTAEAALADVPTASREGGRPDPESARSQQAIVMGVVNVTPDSFSDGGRFFDHDAAVAHGEQLAAEGAAVIDIGGESTRPGAEPVPEEEELRRVVPVIEHLVGRVEARLSVDTTKLEVARRALAEGATIVNDVSAFRLAPEMAGLVASAGAGCCLMHMLGDPRTMQRDPRYDDVVADVKRFLEDRLAFAVSEGVPEDRVWLDPGIGFGKTVEHNLELIRRLDEIVAIGRPVAIGTSRKSFIGRLTGRDEDDRLAGTIAANVMAYERGASVFRVHDVAAALDALRIAAATVGA